MVGRVVLALALVAGALAVAFWPAARPPKAAEAAREPSAGDLVDALERGDPSAEAALLSRGSDGMRALENRLLEIGRGIPEEAHGRRRPHEGDPSDRMIAALGAFGRPAVPGLVRVLRKIPAKRRGVARALGAAGADSPEAIAALLVHLDAEGDEVASALAKAGPGAIPGLLAALRDDARCEGAARVLAAVGATAALHAALAPDAPPESRAAAARALGEAGDAAARDALLAMVRDGEDDAIVRAAAQALCALGAVEPLLGRTRELSDKGPALDGADSAFLVRAAREEGMREGAFLALARKGPLPAEALPLAKQALAGPARGAAAEALGLGCGDPAVPPLLLALCREDPDPYVRIRAAAAYWRLGGDARDVIPILVAELPLGAEDPTKPNAASRALARMGAAAVPALVEALDTDDDLARDRAAAALRDIGRPVHAGEARLKELAASRSAKVAEAAQRILDWLAKLPEGPGS